MNSCYYCEMPVNRFPYDGTHTVCEPCKAKFRKEAKKQETSSLNLAAYWTSAPNEQKKLRERNV